MPKSNPLTLHLRTVGETYLEHAGIAWRTGAVLMTTALACFVHALFPFLFVTTGSRVIRRLHGEIEARGRASQTHRPPETPR